MAKKAKPAESKKLEPRFEPRTLVTVPSLVVDAWGIAWWVDPDNRNIERA